jgi:hypothetical protein
MLCAANESAWAQTVTLEQLCGKYPDFSFTERERELSESEAVGKVDVLKRFFGTGELAGKIKTEREKYYQKDPKGRALQTDAILLYKICTLIESDPSIPTREKIKIFLEARAVLSMPVSQDPASKPLVPAAAPQAAPAAAPAPAAVPPAVASRVPAPPHSERLNVDGIWKVTSRPRNCRNPGRKFLVAVSNGIVSSEVARQMQGSLSTDGTIQFNYVVRDNKGYIWTNFMKGNISGDRGFGSMHSLGRGTDCRGAFQIVRSH